MNYLSDNKNILSANLAVNLIYQLPPYDTMKQKV